MKALAEMDGPGESLEGLYRLAPMPIVRGTRTGRFLRKVAHITRFEGLNEAGRWDGSGDDVQALEPETGVDLGPGLQGAHELLQAVQAGTTKVVAPLPGLACHEDIPGVAPQLRVLGEDGL